MPIQIIIKWGGRADSYNKTVVGRMCQPIRNESVIGWLCQSTIHKKCNTKKIIISDIM